jgi:phosphohistidine phosphatase
LLYQADIPAVMGAIKKTSDAADSAMFFGHNPEFLDMANYLARQRTIKFPTCGILAVDFAVSSWKKITEKSGRVIFFDYPKKEF